MTIVAHAPVRTADVGGWTDTWFAGRGVVCSVAVEPGVLARVDRVAGDRGDVHLVMGSFGTEQFFSTRRPSDPARPCDPLLSAACRAVPLDTPIRLTVTSGVPAGSGLGTSAAAAVAVLAALDAAVGRIRTPAELAHAAHALETGLGWQSGVQDQCAAAFGGIRRYDVAYPDLLGTDELADEGVHEALASQLLTVYLGRPHSSSAVHESVIASLGDRSQTVETNDALLDPLRAAAVAAFESLRGRDLVGYGAALTSAHEAARHLHPALISADADRVASIAMRYGAFGWKVNGAGGDGGSIAVLGPDDPGSLRALRAELAQTKGIEVLAVSTTALPVTVTRRPPFAPSAQREPH